MSVRGNDKDTVDLVVTDKSQSGRRISVHLDAVQGSHDVMTSGYDVTSLRHGGHNHDVIKANEPIEDDIRLPTSTTEPFSKNNNTAFVDTTEGYQFQTTHYKEDILDPLSNHTLDYINVSKYSFIDGLPDGYFPDTGNLTLCDTNVTHLCFPFNDTLTTADPDDDPEVYPDPRYWLLCLCVFPLFTIFGNLLICLAVYKERQLRSVTNYFIVSLAVADIMVAALVMPLAVYVEITSTVWQLGNALCDTWVAFDVLCCTASILNLTAISIDRFLAVTRPIQYATYKTSNRVWYMLAGVWIISIAISSPIALGMNYTPLRVEIFCTFYNSDFLIYSSMGSFWIPCAVMIILYYRIFKVIRDRASRTKKREKANDARNYRTVNVIENRAHTPAGAHSSSDNSNTEENANHKNELSAMPTTYSTHLTVAMPDCNHAKNNGYNGANHETSFMNQTAKTDTDTDTPANCHCQRDTCATSDDTDHVIANSKYQSATSDEECLRAPPEVQTDKNGGGDAEYIAPTCVETTQTFEPVNSPTSYSNKALLSPPPPRKNLSLYSELTPGHKTKKAKTDAHRNGSPRKYVTKFNFNIRHNSRKKKDRSSSNKKERKATRTLAIVLGMFLLCWVPFFTINIMNAICIKLGQTEHPACNLDPMLFSLFVWLGYINSFMNPVIYTIFNTEFRKAFKKILCTKSGCC